MNSNQFLGVIFHWLGGLASGSFYVPFKGVRKWSWETFWLAGGMFSWFICPWIGALLLSKDLFAVLRETSAHTFWMTYLMGTLWGLGGLTFGLTMRYLGMSLGMAIALGYCAAFGTLVPPIVKGEFAAKLLHTQGGNVCFIGIIICLLGIVVGGVAGVRKEREMAAGGSTLPEFNLWKGLAIATFSGVMSSCFSFGFQFGEPIKDIAAAHGTGPLWAGLPVVAVILLGGLTTNFIWCVMLHIKNRSAHQYFSRIARPIAGQTAVSDGHGGKGTAQSFEPGGMVPLVSNWLFCALAGLFWYLQFFFYQMGESKMGDYKFSSWTLHMASIIIFSTLWGIYFKEWRGARPKTRKLVVVMLALLVGSTVVIGFGNKLSADADAKAKLNASIPAPMSIEDILPKHAQPKLQTIKLWLGAEELTTEMALTGEQQMTGMMFRTSVPENEAMIFVHDYPRQAGYWMKNCPAGLSIAYIDDAGVILEIHDMHPFDTNSVTSTATNVRFALETNQGWYERHNVRTGAVVRTEHGSLRATFLDRR